jgi:hypothetical protein
MGLIKNWISLYAIGVWSDPSKSYKELPYKVDTLLMGSLLYPAVVLDAPAAC